MTEAKPENLVDCDTLGIQREELYCRNITIYQNGEHSPVSSVQRTCVAMSWYVNPIIIGFSPLRTANQTRLVRPSYSTFICALMFRALEIGALFRIMSERKMERSFSFQVKC